MVDEGRITNDGDPRWAEQLAVAQERSKGGRYRSLDRYASQVPLVVAATLAVWGLQEFSIPEVVPVAKRQKKFVGQSRVVPRVERETAMAF